LTVVAGAISLNGRPTIVAAIRDAFGHLLVVPDRSLLHGRLRMTPILFTPSSARRALTEIRPVAERMCRLFRSLEQRKPRRIASDNRVDPVYFRLLVDLCRSFDRIGRSGVQVKDPREGLLDFPAKRDGRDVLLCWKVGEPTLDFWHEAEEGLAGRRRVDEEGPWEEGESRPESTAESTG